MADRWRNEGIPARLQQVVASVSVRAAAHPVILVVCGLAVSVCAVLWHMSVVSNELVRQGALESAVSYTDSLQAFRTLYTEEVVQPARAAGLSVCHDHELREQAIPLPATLSKRLGELISKRDSGTTTRLYSDYPFPWSESGGPRSRFELEALAALRGNPDEPFYRFETAESGETLHFATADVMRESCVSCHNSHPDSPRTDWKVGDVRGILRVSVPLHRSAGMVAAGLQQTFLLLFALCGLSVTAFVFVLRRNRRTADRMERANHLLQQQKSDLVHVTEALEQMHSASEQRAEKLEKLRKASLNMMRDAEQSRRESDAANAELSQEIADRIRLQDELEELQQEHIDVARHAGMAEIATGVLHNVGNVLNSVNVSAHLIEDRVRGSRAGGLEKAVELIEKNLDDLGGFFSADARGQRLPAYLRRVSAQLNQQDEFLQTEIHKLVENVEHIKEIIQVQQAYARRGGVLEDLDLTEAAESAIRVNQSSFGNHGIEVHREYIDRPVVRTDKHKVLQILVNLISNARNAMVEHECRDRKLFIRATSDGGVATISVRDTGVGIESEHLQQVFQHGFTTREKGHGFGLHSSANAARELGGNLSVSSDGIGLGAEFTLELPIREEALCQ